MDAKETVEQMLKGGKGEFESIVEIYYAKALRLAYLISGSYDDSQDIVQETFTACYLNRSKIKEPQYFERYLYSRKKHDLYGKLHFQNFSKQGNFNF